MDASSRKAAKYTPRAMKSTQVNPMWMARATLSTLPRTDAYPFKDQIHGRRGLVRRHLEVDLQVPSSRTRGVGQPVQATGKIHRQPGDEITPVAGLQNESRALLSYRTARSASK